MVLLTATVVVSWCALGGTADSTQPDAQPGETRIAERALVGLGGGETVRELTQPTPFSMVAFTGDLAGTSSRVRAKRPDGSWGPWYRMEHQTSAPSGEDPADYQRSTDPVFVGTTTSVQIAITRPIDAPPTRTLPAEQSGLGYRPVSTGRPLGQNISAVLITPPQAPADTTWNPPTGAAMPGQAPPIISRQQWGAGNSSRCGSPRYNRTVRAGVVHHTAGSNDYSPLESAGIVKAIYAYHTRTLGWCDIAYNALVDKYGQVFEGRAGGITKPVQGAHTGGFNRDTWAVAMLGNFDEAPPTPMQMRTVGRLLGWRLGMAGVDPLGSVDLTSAGGGYTTYPHGTVAHLPAIFTHRDVGNTDCPGKIVYDSMDEIRELAAHFNDPPEELLKALEGGVIYEHWQHLGGLKSYLGAPTSTEQEGAAGSRFVTFTRGAMYWSDAAGPQPLTGAIYDAWASLGYERGPLGLPTSAEIDEPLQITQNFAHGTLNFERLTGAITAVVNGTATPVALPGPNGPTEAPEHFSMPMSLHR
ncbi:N-acetylmuramoyl-L-alanine amidase [Mycobacterium sp.]|uniref:N-acetylmuramoyl-L-alanine amidase n=1 Tax=Mycobacterium sp. TaxID=1785 RepID=UPI003A855EAC